MAKIITAYLSDLMQQHLQGGISFSRMVELLNEKAQESEHTKTAAINIIGKIVFPNSPSRIEMHDSITVAQAIEAMEEYRNQEIK